MIVSTYHGCDKVGRCAGMTYARAIAAASKQRVETMDSSAIKSAKRVLEVFEFFAQRRGSATIGEISKALGYPQSSTSVLMKCLHELRYMQHDVRQRTYRPTLRLALTSSWLRDQHFSGSELTSLMTTLRDETGGSVVLGIQNGIDLQYIQVVPTLMPVQLVMRIGQLRPLCRTAVGKVLLAQQSEDKIAATVRRINARNNKAERINFKALMNDLVEVRRTSIAYSVNAASFGAAVIAAPLALSDRDLPMAIGIGGPVDYIEPNRAKITGALKNALHLA
jgi:DNA-binding IclR family transcriptional regulator